MSTEQPSKFFAISQEETPVPLNESTPVDTERSLPDILTDYVTLTNEMLSCSHDSEAFKPLFIGLFNDSMNSLGLRIIRTDTMPNLRPFLGNDIDTAENPAESDVPTCRDFIYALKYLRQGYAITREGWNGKGLYVVYQKGYPDGIGINQNTSEALKLPEGTVVGFRPYLMLCSPKGSTMQFGNTQANDLDCVPWVPSQTDLLAEDWIVLY